MAEKVPHVITVDGIPYRLKADPKTPRSEVEQALRWKLQTDPAYKADRMAALAKMGFDPFEAAPGAERLGAVDRFRIGAGRQLTRMGRAVNQGAQMAFGLDPSRIQESRRQESNERELYAPMDEQQVGAEDVGELLPELVLMAGSGGIGSLAARGALSGALASSGEDDSLKTNVGLGAVLGGLGGGVVQGASRLFRSGAKFTTKGAGVLRQVLQSGGIPEAATVLSRTFRQADMSVASRDPAVRKLGQEALAQARTIVNQMNSFGREQMFKREVTSLFQESVRTVKGRNVLDIAKFTGGLEAFSKGALMKELGKGSGSQLDKLRVVLRETQNLPEMTVEQGQALLRSMMSWDKAGEIAEALARAKTPTARQALLKRLLDKGAEMGANAPAHGTAVANQGIRGDVLPQQQPQE